MERYQEVMVVPSESVMKNIVKRPQAEKSRLCHIRLAMKSRYLVNHASQIKKVCTIQCYTIKEGNIVIIGRRTRLYTKAIG